MLFLNLKNFWLSIKKDKFLLLALFVGLILRGLNPTFGSPSLYVSNDEAIAHLAAFNMIASRTPVSIANYTPLGAYVQIPFLIFSFLAMKTLGYVNAVSDFELFVLTHEGYFLFIPRLISILFGTLTILVIYKMTLALYGEKKIAIIAAFLTAVSFNFVHISHFGRPWSAALFFFVLAVYFVLKNKNLLSFVSVCLSYGFHQVGVLTIPLVFFLAKKKLTLMNLIGTIFMILMISIFSSLTLKTGLIESIRRDQSFLKSGKLAADFLVGNPDLVGSAIRSFWGNLSVYFVVNLLLTDGILFLFGVWGIVKNFGVKDSRREIIYYVLLYFVSASLFFHPLIRYLLPIILLTIPFAAQSINSAFKRKSYFILAVLILASVNSLWWNYLYLKKPTFIQAREWIIQNLNPSVSIAYTGTRYRTFLPNKNAIFYSQKFDEGFYERLSKFSPPDNFENVRNIIYLGVFPGNDKLAKFENASSGYKISYVLDYYIDPSERLYSLKPEKFIIAARFNPTRNDETVGIPEPLFDSSWNFPVNDSRPKLSMYSIINTGPYVDVLKIIY